MRLGGPEIILILLVVVLIFGVGKLPQLGKSLGEGLRGFKEASGEGGTSATTTSSSTSSTPAVTTPTETPQLSAQEQQEFKEWQEFKKWQASQSKPSDEA